MIALFTLISISLAYPYYGIPYYYGEPVLMQTMPATAPATPATGMGGAMAQYRAMLDRMMPGLGSNPGMYYMMGEAVDGDMKEVAEKAMKGDAYGAMDKMADLDFPPQMYGMMGQRIMGAQGGMAGGLPGASAGSSTATSRTTPTMSPYMWGLIDLQRPRVQPVSSRMQAMPATGATGRAGGMGGMAAYNPYTMAMNFMNMLMPGFSSSPQNFMMYNTMADGNIGEAFGKAMKGDLKEAVDKLDFEYPMAMASGMMGRGRGSPAGATAATGGATARTQSTMSPYMWGLIDLQKPRAAQQFMPGMGMGMGAANRTAPMYGYGPYGMAMNFMNMLMPGLTSSPQNFYMYNAMADGNIGEAMGKAMQGDFKEAVDKIDLDYPMMPMAMGMGGATTRGPAASTGTAARKPMNPYQQMMMYDMINLQKANPTLSQPRTFIQPVIYPDGEVRYFPVEPLTPVNSRLSL